MFNYSDLDTPLGVMRLVACKGELTGVHFVGEKHFPQQTAAWQQADDEPTLQAACQEISEYYSGVRQQFDIALAPQGTPFQRRVWQTLLDIPYGATRSYKALAAAIGQPKAVRAVAAAVGRNPICIMIPCHRIIGSDGSLTGYAAGIPRKQALLSLEER